ncbi:MAG: triose-phosphate isomerase [Phycisphaerae bacterium]
MRRPFVAGNWKMNGDLKSTRELIAGVAAGLRAPLALDVAVCPSFVYLMPAAKAVSGTPIALGGQDLWPEAKGAFTGAVSAAMLKEAGCQYVIVGHSERRHTIGSVDAAGHVRGEDDALVNRKARFALAEGLTPIVCVGETLAERDAGQTAAVLTRQIQVGLSGLSAPQVSRLVVAYEPVWAIGTGRNATPEQAAEAHKHIRNMILQDFGGAAAGAVRILYGGSVKPANAAELLRSADVDGALVGGASLVAADFLGIISGCVAAKGLG